MSLAAECSLRVIAVLSLTMRRVVAGDHLVQGRQRVHDHEAVVRCRGDQDVVPELDAVRPACMGRDDDARPSRNGEQAVGCRADDDRARGQDYVELAARPPAQRVDDVVAGDPPGTIDAPDVVKHGGVARQLVQAGQRQRAHGLSGCRACCRESEGGDYPLCGCPGPRWSATDRPSGPDGDSAVWCGSPRWLPRGLRASIAGLLAERLRPGGPSERRCCGASSRVQAGVLLVRGCPLLSCFGWCPSWAGGLAPGGDAGDVGDDVPVAAPGWPGCRWRTARRTRRWLRSALPTRTASSSRGW